MIDLLNSMDALRKISEQELDGLLAYKIGKSLQIITNQLDLYNNSRQTLINKYGIKDQNGKLKILNNDTIQILPQYIQTYNDEIQKMNEVEVELNISQLEFEDLKNIKLSPRQITGILWLIKKDTPE